MGGGKRVRARRGTWKYWQAMVRAGEQLGQCSLEEFTGVKHESVNESLGQYIKRHQKLIGKV